MSEDFKIIEEGNHLQRKQARKSKEATLGMMQCPYCHAMSYPRIIFEPSNDEERNAIFCGSCHANVRPYIEAMKKYENRMQQEWNKKNTTNGISLTNDEDKIETYPDATSIIEEVLTS